MQADVSLDQAAGIDINITKQFNSTVNENFFSIIGHWFAQSSVNRITQPLSSARYLIDHIS